MGETPTLLTCGICGEKSLRIHNLVACIDALKEALAAARRECGLCQKALEEIIGATDDDVAEKIARAALAAPADGEEK